jgi:hypothetical protein
MKRRAGATVQLMVFGFAVALTAVGAFATGCDATRRDEATCYQSPCGPNRVCTLDHHCVPALDAGAQDASHAEAPLGQGQGIDSASAPGVIDGSSADRSLAIDADDDVPISAGTVDGAAGEGLDSATEAGLVGLDVGGIDANIPDGPGTCANDTDCASKDAPYCAQGRCVPCKTGDQCGGGSPICSASHTCTSCAAVDAGCPAATPACEVDSGRCVECLSGGDCVRDVTRSFCQAGLCVGCAGAGASACAGRNSAQPICMPSGTCAECATSDDCKAAAKPICDTTANACVACTHDDQCQAKVGGPGVCLFQQDGHCATDTESVYVRNNGAGTCSDLGVGSAQMPYCTAQKGIDEVISVGKTVVVVMGQVQPGFVVGAHATPLTIVGRSAVITPVDYADGIAITSGEIYLRTLTVAGNPSGVTGIGVNSQAASSAAVVLHMDGCTIKDNPGGGVLLVGTGFDIRNSAMTGNGPGQTTGGTVWGGLRVESLPAGGPASLDLVTIQNNLAPGLTCSSAIQGQGVLALGNTPLNIAISCGIVSCAASGPTCGEQP